jgi:hypothetical protein
LLAATAAFLALPGLGCETGPAGLAPVETCPPPATGKAPLRLLTRAEYDNTVRDLLGIDLRPSRTFPPEPHVGGFDNNAASHLANPLLVEQMTLAARELATHAIEERLDALAPCPPPAESHVCAEDFVATFGRRAFRRPLEPAEKASFLRLYGKAAPSLGYGGGLGLVLEAMLLSPQFLYRVEAPLTALSEADSATVPLGPFELASRLSYFLWGSLPDDELLDAAERGELGPDELAAQARRMLEDPRARARVTEFHAQWLGLRRFDTVVREGALPEFNDSWRRSVLAFVDDVFWSEEATVADLFTSRAVFLDAALGPLYGQNSIPDAALVPVELEASRSGLLTQPGLMSMLAHSDQSSPIQRGVFVREHILCRPVPAPPPTVDNTPPDPDPNATTRERFAVHTADPSCATCHRLIDPVGFGFEEFDELGRHRAEENGAPIDASGELVHSPDPALDGPFDGAAELSARLARSSAPLECLSRYWYRFALGRMDGKEDACTTSQVAELVRRSGGRLEELLVALVSTESFRTRARWPDEHVDASQEAQP